jgi:hypothetical protein
MKPARWKTKNRGKLSSQFQDHLSPNSTIHTMIHQKNSTSSYDPASQVTQILHQLTASATQINQAAYNPVGNWASLTKAEGVRLRWPRFGYDCKA